MALFNNGFPTSYQPFSYGYQPYQQTVPQMQGTQMSSSNQMMTPPTIRAEIVQVDGQDAAERYPLAAGASQMMIARDDSFIAVKTVQGDGQYSVTYYDKRPPAPPEPPLDLSVYARRDEVEAMIAAALGARQEPQKATRKKEEKTDERI